jgi:hypothetical protein
MWVARRWTEGVPLVPGRQTSPAELGSIARTG